ncbi:MAG: hypothetical protein ACRDC4_05705, partial [Plesiomonas sp.]
MNTKLTPPDWDDINPNMILNAGDAKYYYENFTSVVNDIASKNKDDIGDLVTRVSAIEHQLPVGPGGDGAYLDLGGTPGRYPSPSEMTDAQGQETSFMVIARSDGIYFYNPSNKLLIPPKKGGGNMAVHGQFPQIFDDGHSIQHNGRVGMSGVYTAKVKDLDLDTHFTSYNTTKVLVVVTADMEYQTALHPDGTASRIFSKGSNTANWSLHSGSGGGGGGGTIDPDVLLEINRRLQELEDEERIDEFVKLKDGPKTYAGQAGMLLKVNDAETGLDYVVDSAIPIMSALEEGNIPI